MKIVHTYWPPDVYVELYGYMGTIDAIDALSKKYAIEFEQDVKKVFPGADVIFRISMFSEHQCTMLYDDQGGKKLDDIWKMMWLISKQ